VDWVPTKRYCYNCGRLLHSFRMGDNTAKFACTCGVRIYSTIKARRKEEVQVYLPHGSFIVDFRMDASNY
jgi:hypothetical protein